jgi:hypothetical protein
MVVMMEKTPSVMARCIDTACWLKSAACCDVNYLLVCLALDSKRRSIGYRQLLFFIRSILLHQGWLPKY